MPRKRPQKCEALPNNNASEDGGRGSTLQAEGALPRLVERAAIVPESEGLFLRKNGSASWITLCFV
jgi:hypothetical protein